MRFLRAPRSSVVLDVSVFSSLSRFLAIGDVGCVEEVGNCWEVEGIEIVVITLEFNWLEWLTIGVLDDDDATPAEELGY